MYSLKINNGHTSYFATLQNALEYYRNMAKRTFITSASVYKNDVFLYTII